MAVVEPRSAYERAGAGYLLDLQMTTVEQEGGRGGFVKAPAGVFAQWMRDEATAAAAANSTAPRFYLSELESFTDLCPNVTAAAELMQDMANLEPFKPVLPCGSMLPRPWLPFW